MLGLFLVIALSFKNKLFALFCIIFFLLGAFHFNLTLLNIPEKPDTPLEGRVVKEPYLAGQSTRVVLEHEEGRVLIYSEIYSDINYGDILKVDGDFKRPTPKGYAQYLDKEGVHYIAFFPNIVKKGSEKSLLYSGMLSLRERMKSNIRKSIPPPESHILEAMILGDRYSFSDELNEKLSVSGTRHITAISGMHIIIITTIIFYILSYLRVREEKAALLSFFFIAFFIIFVGAPTSAIRAGIMGVFTLLTLVSFKVAIASPFRILAFAGAVMLVFNPLFLRFDLGFQLSFLAVLGIISLHNPLKRFLTKRTGFAKTTREFFRKNEKIADLLAVTLGAQILVFPLILYNFGNIPLLSIPANLLIVPLLPFIMISGILTALTGFYPFSFLAYLLSSFVIFVIDITSSLPFSAIFIENISFHYILLLYTIILLTIHKKTKTLKMP